MPDEAGKFQNINLALMATNVAIVLYAVPLVDIARGKKSGAAAKAQLVALLEMEVAFVATLIAAILVAQGYYLADPFASIFVGSVVVLSGLYLLRDNVDYLLGRAPSRKFVELVESTAKSVEGVLDIRDRKAWYVGPNIVHTGFHIEVAKGTPIEEADRIAEAVNERVGRKTGCQHRVIHVDPARKSPSRNRRRSGEKPDSRRAGYCRNWGVHEGCGKRGEFLSKLRY